MSGIADPQATRLAAFDCNGGIVGSADGARLWGRWFVRVGPDEFFCLDEADARRMLEQAGAVRFESDDGRKGA